MSRSKYDGDGSVSEHIECFFCRTGMHSMRERDGRYGDSPPLFCIVADVRSARFIDLFLRSQDVMRVMYKRQSVHMVYIHVRQNHIINIGCFIAERCKLFIDGLSLWQFRFACKIQEQRECCSRMCPDVAVP